jgi:hypothetical protein
MTVKLRRRRYLALAITAGVVAAGATALPPLASADESSRRRLRDEIDRLLSDIASELRDVPGDSGTSDLERTIDYAGRVAEKARDLKNEAEDDSDARKIGESYPDIASRYRDHAGYLRELKNGYRKLDEWPRRCEIAGRELAERMRAYTNAGDPRGADEIPKLAREFGRVGKDALEQGERIRSEMATWADRADDFSYSDGRWSDVRGNLASAARALLEHTQRQHEQVKRDDVCGYLAREDRNPAVEEAMRKLYEGKRGIEALYEAMDRQLGEIASSLDRLEGDSSDSDLGAAESRLGDLERNLEQLDRVRGADPEARRRVETWRAIARANREAVAQLRILKQAQFAADRAPEKCGEANARLGEVVRRYVDVQDTKGKTMIPTFARNLAGPIKDGLAKTDQQHSAMERAMSEAGRFTPSEGRWRDVAERSRASASAMFEHWKKAREAAHAACDDLARGEDNPTVIKAVKAIDESISSNERELLLLQNEVQRWYDGIVELRGWYKQDTAAVREAVCNLDDSPGDPEAGAEVEARVKQIADRMRDRIGPRWSTIRSEAATMTATADRLLAKNDDEVKKGAEKAKERIARVIASLTNVMNDELHGSNDPQLRAKMETGKNEHKRIQADSSKCTVAELSVGNRRIDCIRVDGNVCYVVEIKPNNDKARDRGNAQIAKGKENIQNAMRGIRKKAELTGDLSVFQSCFDESASAANLKDELRVYELCPPDGELFRDFVVP